MASEETGEEESRTTEPLIIGQTPSTKKSSFRRQVFLGIIVVLPSVPCGMSLGYSAVSMDELSLTLDEASWFASITLLFFPLGWLIIGPVMEKFGRRPSLLLISGVNLIGWLLLSIPSSGVSLPALLIGRAVTGVAAGLASTPAAIYASECLASDELTKTPLMAWSTVGLGGGLFLVYAAGAGLSYYNVASIATLMSILAIILVAIYIPESPEWLSSKGRSGDADWSRKELNITPPAQAQPSPETSAEEDQPPSEPKTWKDLKKPDAYKPLLVMIGFLLFQQFSGVYVMIAYLVDVIRAAGIVTVNPYAMAVIAGLLIVVICALAVKIYPKMSIRSLAVLSGIGVASAMYLNGALLLLRPVWLPHPSLSFLHWIPVFVFMANISASTSSLLILHWSLLGEGVFSVGTKGLAFTITAVSGFLFGFVVLKLYPYIQLSYGVSGLFFFFGTMALLGVIFAVIFMSNTKGKTLKEIFKCLTNPKKEKEEPTTA